MGWFNRLNQFLVHLQGLVHLRVELFGIQDESTHDGFMIYRGRPNRKRKQEPSAGFLAGLITLPSHPMWQVEGKLPIPDSDFAAEMVQILPAV